MMDYGGYDGSANGIPDAYQEAAREFYMIYGRNFAGIRGEKKTEVC